ncbi:hypothetical protein Sru01_28540 [Sphaerisporangium rufum]|uniref:Lipoprotein n=1 Tax=Sphaerisporangium rufum TaxID=1381558 RepID=A0A919R662_9ACTN|nr:SurA N-terminal domain-containing protein [Sphaerisporangium rufum]GII77872.1 hypothetical protein Sru01_28540 [Sphaerisporangium rufum]
MKSNRLRVLLAAAAATAGLTACSSPVGVGTAATVGGERITTARLNADVVEFQNAVRTAKIPPDQLQIQSSVPQAVLLQLVQMRQFRQFAERQGVTVSDGDLDKFVAEQGGLEKIGPNALIRGVPPSETREWIRTALIYQKSLERFGANLTDQASQQAAQAKLFQQLDTIPIKVAHRYGTWDTQRGLVEEPRFGAPAQAEAPAGGQGQGGGQGEPDPATGQ